MGGRANLATVAFDLKLISILIPAVETDAARIRRCMQTSLLAKAQIETIEDFPDWWDRVITWEIVDNRDSFHVSFNPDMREPAIRVEDLEGFAPSVSRKLLSSFFLRSVSEQIVQAVLVIYLSDNKVDWDLEF